MARLEPARRRRRRQRDLVRAPRRLDRRRRPGDRPGDARGRKWPRSAQRRGGDSMSAPTPPLKRFEDGSGEAKPDESRRGFFYFTPKKRRASVYEEVTID